MQIALLAIAIFAVDSQTLPRAELDDAINAAKAAELAKLELNLGEARRALALAVKLPAEQKWEVAHLALARFDAIRKELEDAKKDPGHVPHLCFQKLNVGQIGKIYRFGHNRRPFSVDKDGMVYGKGWYDLPADAELVEIVDATTAIAIYRGVRFKVRTDTAALKFGYEIRLAGPLKIVGIDRTDSSNPVWEVRFFER